MSDKNIMNSEQHISNLQNLNPEKVEIDVAIDQLLIGSYLAIEDEDFVVAGIFKYREVDWDNFSEIEDPSTFIEIKLTAINSDDEVFIGWQKDDIDDLWISTEIPPAEVLCKSSDKVVSFEDLEYLAEDESGSVVSSLTSDDDELIDYVYSDEDTLSFIDISDVSAEDAQSEIQNKQKYDLDQGRFYSFYSSVREQALTFEVWDMEDGDPEIDAFLEEELSKDDIKIWHI